MLLAQKQVTGSQLSQKVQVENGIGPKDGSLWINTELSWTVVSREDTFAALTRRSSRHSLPGLQMSGLGGLSTEGPNAVGGEE